MPRTDDRVFAPFPIEMDEHPKIAILSDAAFRAVFEATFYARRMLTDGFLDRRIVLKRWGQAVADELSSNDDERPTWIPVEGGWQIHGFEKYHPLKADIEAGRKKKQEAGRRGGEASGRSRSASPERSTTEADVKQNGSETNPESESESESESETYHQDLDHHRQSHMQPGSTDDPSQPVDKYQKALANTAARLSKEAGEEVTLGQAGVVVDHILGKASGEVKDPARYVSRSISGNVIGWTRFIHTGTLPVE
jgi:hypothetical protein